MRYCPSLLDVKMVEWHLTRRLNRPATGEELLGPPPPPAFSFEEDFDGATRILTEF